MSVVDAQGNGVQGNGAHGTGVHGADTQELASVDGKQTLQSLQILRGIAALAVAIYHTHLILAKPEYGSIDLFGATSGKGWLGVNFFFVLSGFIILYAHLRDVGQPSRAPQYIWRRVSRVYPIYWLVLTAYIAAALAGIGHPDFRVTAPDLASSYLLLPLVASPSLPLQVAWTLFYEVAFYAVFLIAILHRVAGAVVATMWIAAILVNALVLGRTGMGPLNMWNIYFPAGAGAFFLFRVLDRRLGVPLLLAGVALLVALGLAGLIDNRIAATQERPLRLLILAAPFMLIVLGATLAERGRHWRAPAAAMLLGNASYAVYLVHSPVISLIAQLHHRLLPDTGSPVLLFALTALLSVLAGVMAHLLLERPLLALLRHPPGWRRAPAAGGARDARGRVA